MAFSLKWPPLIVAAALSLLCSRLSAQEVRIWNGDPAGPHLDIVGDDVNKELKPIRIVGARNGTFSGKVVLCAAGTLKDVSAKITDLDAAGKKGKVPASQVQVRLATGWIKSGWLVQSKAGSTFDILNEGRVDEAPPLPAVPGHDKYHPWIKPGRSYVPVWVTVHVPANAAEGEYSGTLTVNACGASKPVPVRLTVCGYTLPDPKDFRTWIETIESPDSLALEYSVPLWSEKHWKLIEESLRYGAMLGNRSVYFPLLCETNFGNAESAVRWIKEGENRYKHDFSLVEKYLDLQTKVQGKPSIVCFPVWDTFLEGGQFGGDIKYEPEEVKKQRLEYQGKGPEVTVLDGAGGKPHKQSLPQYSDPAAMPLWTPLIRRIPEVLEKHGLAGALFFGMANDAVPPSSALDVVNRNIPGARWVIHAHSYYGNKDKKANFQYAAFVWGVEGFCCGKKGWLGKFLLVQFMRNMDDHFPITSYRLAPEVNITGGQRGLGRIGLDYFRSVKDSKGRRAGQVWERYPKANWRNLNITDCLLAPGREGPIATARFEMLREGVQEAEARIFVQTALDSGRLPGDLVDQAKKLLADRDDFLRKIAIMTQPRPWFNEMNPSDEAYSGYVAGWQQQSEKLYKLAAEITHRVGAR